MIELTENTEKISDDIPLDSDDTQILTANVPNFTRVFARGTLLQYSEEDPETLQVGFWTEREEDIQLDDDETATGYRLESEAVMTWRTAQRLRKLLGYYIEEHGPEDIEADD